ncbi:hypothetical protein L2E82_16321 [Cichorium intybus]|uniref:Uncharacterized protein n=1 Tax=Cichorium intybus TaxID=13427 RepID=A0ACB9F4J5_CICIN|nr:hypothetical protein L2E82_16321 [Cichorium intybus]
MSRVWSSQGVVLATAMAVSGTMILLSLLRSTVTSSDENRDSSSAEAPPRRRSCLASVKKDGRMKKKVRFLENVEDTDRKAWSEIEYVSDCKIETLDFNGARNLLVEFSR